MNNRQRKTLREIFDDPIRADIDWRQVESLLIALGAEMKQGKGSRVRFVLHGRTGVLHRPHPGKELDRGAVNDLRDLLVEAGVEP